MSLRRKTACFSLHSNTRYDLFPENEVALAPDPFSAFQLEN